MSAAPAPCEVDCAAAHTDADQTKEERHNQLVAGSHEDQAGSNHADGEARTQAGRPSVPVHEAAHLEAGDGPAGKEDTGGDPAQRCLSRQLRKGDGRNSGHQLDDSPAERHANGQDQGVRPNGSGHILIG